MKESAEFDIQVKNVYKSYSNLKLFIFLLMKIALIKKKNRGKWNE
ncbi:hypothetical protein ES705_26237 [subsurface metagenome]